MPWTETIPVCVSVGTVDQFSQRSSEIHIGLMELKKALARVEEAKTKLQTKLFKKALARDGLRLWLIDPILNLPNPPNRRVKGERPNLR